MACLWSLLAARPAPASHTIPSRNINVVAHFNDFPPVGGSRYSSCWHYVHPDGREYAIIGHQRGIGIYNVTIPNAAYLVDSIAGSVSGWRELKSYRSWIYVVNESGGGLQIIRMTDPENPVVVANYTTTFQTAHTVSVDTTRALLFANGTRSGGLAAGMRILSLANPESPVEIGRWPAVALPVQNHQYVHDASIRGNRLYAAAIYGGGIRVIDIANPASPFEAWNFGYWNSNLPHNSWPDASGQYLYATDEANGMPLAVFDVTAYTTPYKLPVYEWTANPQAVVHNAHVNRNDLWLAHYTEGVYVLDATDPRHPAAFGYADTYSGASGGYRGCWGVDPYFPSGIAIASDMSTGLYVLQVQRNYGVVRVEVTDATTLEPMDSVMVRCTTQGDSLKTPFYGDGTVAFAPQPGLHTFEVPDDLYRVSVRRPGYISVEFERRIGPGFEGVQDFYLKPGVAWDNLATGTGWSVNTAPDESHVSSSGRWVRTEPFGTSDGSPFDLLVQRGRALAFDAAPIRPRAGPLHDDYEGSGATFGPVQPDLDRSPSPDSLCFVTGNSGSFSIDAADVDSTTTLTSAVYDLTGMTTPMIGVWMWFYSQFRHPDDYMAVLISNNNGTTWVPLDTLRGTRNHWAEYSYAVANFVVPTNQVRLRFVAVDGGENSVVECAVDDVVVYDGATVPLGVLEGEFRAALQFRAAWPNPSASNVQFVLANPTAGFVEVDVIDVSGRHVRTLHRGPARAGTLTLQWDGAGEGRQVAPAGIYFVRARAQGMSAHSRFVRMP